MKIRKRFNRMIALEILLLAGYAFFFLRTSATGEASMYVHPRIIPFLIFGAASMLIIALVKLGELFQGQHEGYKPWTLVFFALPLLMAFTIHPQTFDSTTRTLSDIRLSVTQGEAAAEAEDGESAVEKEAEPTGKQRIESAGEEEAKAENNQESEQNALIMNAGNFVQCLNDVYGDPESYIGMPIEVECFVFHDGNQFKEDEFVAARLMMVCCAADMQPVGFLCRYDGANELEPDSWVTVYGTIGQTDFDGERIPYIEAERIEETENPDRNYIYPY